jgi:wyosine [tRNA(Phe)-imidazoG37] synthetase (radical SAM superfamily)
MLKPQSIPKRLTEREMKSFVYGPVPSRRLGFSLGVDILPYKTCSFDCVYCQLGRTPQKSEQRRRFFPSREIVAQIREALSRNQRIDHITFSGSGEPTLNAEIGPLIRQIKKLTSIPVAVLTNSSMLTRKSVRQALLAADLVVPSLDAATVPVFRKVNRPLPSLKLEKIIQSLVQFRREFKGEIWLEIMLVKGVNDSRAEIEALRRAAARIKPDKIHLHTVVRPPAEFWARPLNQKELKEIRVRLGDRVETVAGPKKSAQFPATRDLKKTILAIVRRRPVTLEDMAASLGRAKPAIRPQLESLVRWGRVVRRKHKGVVYYDLRKD